MNIDITSSLRCALRETLIGNQQLVLDIGCGDGQITGLYSSERKSKRLAIQAARNLSGKTFSLISEKTIQISDHQQSWGYEDGPWKGRGHLCWWSLIYLNS
jgi:cyclopropane fatty-acyl-phospholipid synthase-like methyltransferase